MRDKDGENADVFNQTCSYTSRKIFRQLYSIRRKAIWSILLSFKDPDGRRHHAAPVDITEALGWGT